MQRIPLPLPTDGLEAVNVYALETEHGLALSLRGIGFAMEDILRTAGAHDLPDRRRPLRRHARAP